MRFVQCERGVERTPRRCFENHSKLFHLPIAKFVAYLGRLSHFECFRVAPSLKSPCQKTQERIFWDFHKNLIH